MSGGCGRCCRRPRPPAMRRSTPGFRRRYMGYGTNPHHPRHPRYEYPWACKKTLHALLWVVKERTTHDNRNGQCNNISSCVMGIPDDGTYGRGQFNADYYFNYGIILLLRKSRHILYYGRRIINFYHLPTTTASIQPNNRLTQHIPRLKRCNIWIVVGRSFTA